MSMWYDRQGQPMDDMKEVERRLRDPAYKRVAETTLPGGIWISTVWLGLDHGHDDKKPPVIFETMVFAKSGEFNDLDCERYRTEEEAMFGHQAMVQKWLDKTEETQ